MMEVFIPAVAVLICVGAGSLALCMYCGKYGICKCHRCTERTRQDALVGMCTKVRFSTRNSHTICSNETCPICLDEFKQRERIMLTPCKHGFHRECLISCLENSPLCPVCKTTIQHSPVAGSRDQSVASGSHGTDSDQERTPLIFNPV